MDTAAKRRSLSERAGASRVPQAEPGGRKMGARLLVWGLKAAVGAAIAGLRSGKASL